MRKFILWTLFALSLAFAFTTTIAYSDRPFKWPGTNTVPRSNPDKMADFRSALDYGARPDGTDISSNLNNAISDRAGTIYLPANSTCYNIGTTTINLAAGRTLQGGGMGGASAGPTCILYTGTGCAILLDSVSYAGVKDIDVQVNSSSATAAGICVKSTTVVSEFNEIKNVSIRQINATNHVVGSFGLYLNDNANGIFWNKFTNLRASGWDVAYRLSGGTTQGVNDNDFSALMSWSSLTGMRITSTGFAADNLISGLKCSRSDGSLVASINCLLIGDDNSSVFGNQFYGVVSDLGVPSVCGTLGTQARASTIFANCESGGPFADNSIATAFPNIIWDPIQAKLRTGPLIGIAAAGNSTTAAALILGQVPFSGAGSGVRIRASSVIQANKGSPVDCGGAALGPTASSIVDFSFYTCATAQTLTLPTAQGATGIVQRLAGNGTAYPPQVGDIFQFYMSSTAAANFTLVAGAGATIIGNAVVNNAMRIWVCRVTGVVAGSETINCY